MTLALANGEAGPLGLVVVVLLGLATVLLIRNMDKRIKRLPTQFEQQPERPRRRPARSRDAGLPGADLPEAGLPDGHLPDAHLPDVEAPRTPGQREP